MAESKGGLVTVRSPFFVGNRLVSVGEVYGPDDPVVVGRPGSFRPVEVKVSGAAPRRTAREKATSAASAARKAVKATTKAKTASRPKTSRQAPRKS